MLFNIRNGTKRTKKPPTHTKTTTMKTFAESPHWITSMRLIEKLKKNEKKIKHITQNTQSIEANAGNETQKKSTSPYSSAANNTTTAQSLNDRGTENTNPNMLCTDNERLLMLQRFASNNYCSSDESEDSFGTESKQNQWSGQKQWTKKRRITFNTFSFLVLGFHSILFSCFFFGNENLFIEE